MPINLLTTQLLQTQCQGTKKTESMTPRFLNLNQDIVGWSPEVKCALKYVMFTQSRKSEKLFARSVSIGLLDCVHPLLAIPVAILKVVRMYVALRDSESCQPLYLILDRIASTRCSNVVGSTPIPLNGSLSARMRYSTKPTNTA